MLSGTAVGQTLKGLTPFYRMHVCKDRTLRPEGLRSTKREAFWTHEVRPIGVRERSDRLNPVGRAIFFV